METSAILIAPDGPSGPLRGLVDRLGGVGIPVTIVPDVRVAADVAREFPSPPAVLVDLRAVDPAQVEDLRLATDAVRAVVAEIPNTLPVIIADDLDGALVVACLRAGAADAIDLAAEGTATARAVIQRICQRQHDRSREVTLATQQRMLIEDLLKELIQTERRTIDTEEALAHAKGSGVIPIPREGRSPAVLVLDGDRDTADQLAEQLEASGMTTFAYVTGEDALRELAATVETTGLDLALVAVDLPGMDGLESVRRLRELVPELPAFLITEDDDDDELAARAAELGVVGFFPRPLPDVHEVVTRLVQLARASQQRSREHGYLERIKERHERVLARYRSLPRSV